jgi:dynein heavy chain
MGPPGGGRNPVTARLLRHFHMLSFAELSDESISRIYTTILQAFFANKGFAEGVQLATQPLVQGTVQLYNSIRVELLPTPAKSHYTFNLRDLSKVVQGLMRATPGTCSDPKQVTYL